MSDNCFERPDRDCFERPGRDGAKDFPPNGHNQTAVLEPDELLVCDACNGRGKHCDQWGPWECGLCHGLGYVTRSFWDAWVASFSPQVQAHIRSQPEPAVYQT